MNKQARCTCRVVVLVNKPIAVLKSSLPSPSSLLKLPNILDSSQNDDGQQVFPPKRRQFKGAHYLVILGRFGNRTGTSVDDGGRRSNNWLDQWQSDKLGTRSRVQFFPRAFPSSTDVPVLLLNQPNEEISSSQSYSSQNLKLSIYTRTQSITNYAQSC